jgi:hypothetical protein
LSSNDKLPLVGSEFCQLFGGVVSNYSLTYCMKFGKRLRENFDFSWRTMRTCGALTQPRGARPSINAARGQGGSARRGGTLANNCRRRKLSGGRAVRQLPDQRIEPPSHHCGVPRDNAFHLKAGTCEFPFGASGGRALSITLTDWGVDAESGATSVLPLALLWAWPSPLRSV